MNVNVVSFLSKLDFVRRSVLLAWFFFFEGINSLCAKLFQKTDCLESFCEILPIFLRHFRVEINFVPLTSPLETPLRLWKLCADCLMCNISLCVCIFYFSEERTHKGHNLSEGFYE